MVIDDKGGEVISKDKQRGRETKDSKGRGSTKILKHTSRGSKLINLYVAFVCPLHMFACMAQIQNSLSMLVWCMLDCRKWLMKWKLACIG